MQAAACRERADQGLQRRGQGAFDQAAQMIAAIELLAGRPAAAVPYLDQAEEIFRAGDTLLAIGRVHAAMRHRKQARDYYQKVLAAYKEIGDQHGIKSTTALLYR